MSLQVQAVSRRVKLSSLSLTAGKGPVAMFDAVDFFLRVEPSKVEGTAGFQRGLLTLVDDSCTMFVAWQVGDARQATVVTSVLQHEPNLRSQGFRRAAPIAIRVVTKVLRVGVLGPCPCAGWRFQVVAGARVSQHRAWSEAVQWRQILAQASFRLVGCKDPVGSPSAWPRQALERPNQQGARAFLLDS